MTLQYTFTCDSVNTNVTDGVVKLTSRQFKHLRTHDLQLTFPAGSPSLAGFRPGAQFKVQIDSLSEVETNARIFSEPGRVALDEFGLPVSEIGP